jgi:ATP-binding cassette subfamily C protein CydD
VKPVDPRLLRHAKAARGYLVFTVGSGLVVTGLVLAQAGLLAHALATAARGIGVAALGTTLAVLLAVVAGRALASGAGETVALRTAATVNSQLRARLAAHTLRLGPAWLAGQQTGQIATVASKGLDALAPYFARYLPQLVLAVAVPMAVLARVAAADRISAVVIAVTLPLIPVFAVLIGLHTKARTQRQWRLLATLGGHFLDVVEGLPTLKLFGRARAQTQVIKEVSEAQRRATVSTLRVAFLSALVLELAAALATALVAVEVGLRLLYGHLGYETALVVLLLTPEAYLPLRAVGAQFHASMEGATAAAHACDILDTPLPAPAKIPRAGAQLGPAGQAQVDLHSSTIMLNAVRLTYPTREVPALDGVSLAIRPGGRITVTGPSGAGKSSLLGLLLRFAEPASGTIEAGGIPLDRLDPAAWRAQIGWVPQRPHLFAGTVADNIALGQPAASRAAIERAASLAGAVEFIEALPRGYATPLGERALRLSAGQRQRIALARAFLRDAPLLLLDEPTTHLDAITAAQILTTIESPIADRTVIVVSHGPGLAGSADQTITLDHGKLVAADAREPQFPALPWWPRRDADLSRTQPWPPRRRPGPWARCAVARALGAAARGCVAAGTVAGQAAAGAADPGGAGGCRRHRLRHRAAGHLRLSARPGVAAPEHRGDRDRRGRGTGTFGRPWGVPLCGAAGQPRCGVPSSGGYQGADVPAAGAACPRRAAHTAVG